MMHFRKTKKQTLRLWALLLSTVMLCTQGVTLHVHSVDHDENIQHSHSHVGIEASVVHLHQSEAHLSIDLSHGDHHHEAVSELDSNSFGLLKKDSGNALTLAVLAAVFTLFLAVSYRQIFNRSRDKHTVLLWRYLFSPPLRAPPL
ncbi:MAG: hypothetical protein GXP08_18130 [Gammaproteobacteria bacterium]|nr:hypothetical protein [Gammaproteobacteria bacterium]